MKLLITTFLFVSFSITAFAADQRVLTFYQPSFEIVSAKPICPVTDGGIRCMAYGTKVKIKAQLRGCLDKANLVKTQTRISEGIISIYVVSVAESNPKNDVVRCVKIPEVFQTVMVGTENYKAINIINQTIK